MPLVTTALEIDRKNTINCLPNKSNNLQHTLKLKQILNRAVTIVYFVKVNSCLNAYHYQVDFNPQAIHYAYLGRTSIFHTCVTSPTLKVMPPKPTQLFISLTEIDFYIN